MSSDFPSPLAPKFSTLNTAEPAPAFPPPPFLGGGIVGGGFTGGGVGGAGSGVFCFDLPELPLRWPELWLLPFFLESEVAAFRLRRQCLPTLLPLQNSTSELHTRRKTKIVNVICLRQKPPIFPAAAAEGGGGEWWRG